MSKKRADIKSNNDDKPQEVCRDTADESILRD